jgi:hypothetical protein
MQKKTLELAKQLFNSMPDADIDDLIKTLTHYRRVARIDRIKAMSYGTVDSKDPVLEKEVRALMEKAAGSQDVYVMTQQPSVCRCCGK